MPEIHPKRVRINGRYWKLTSAQMRGYDGLAENDPVTPDKHIWINENLRGVELLDTIIHEVSHCAFGFMNEETILKFGTDLAKILWDLGYRNPEFGDED